MNTTPISFQAEPLALQIANAEKKVSENNVIEENKKEQNVTDTFSKGDKEVEQKDVKPSKKEKKSLFEKLANFIGSIKKAGVNVVEYTKGGAKGVFSFVKGLIATVGAIFVADKVRQGVKAAKGAEGVNAFSEAITRLGKGISKNFTGEGIKVTLKSGKGKLALVAGAAVGVLAFARQIFKAKLAANERNAMIDHRYKNTPVVSK